MTLLDLRPSLLARALDTTDALRAEIDALAAERDTLAAALAEARYEAAFQRRRANALLELVAYYVPDKPYRETIVYAACVKHGVGLEED